MTPERAVLQSTATPAEKLTAADFPFSDAEDQSTNHL
jgi:hypothetical protein